MSGSRARHDGTRSDGDTSHRIGAWTHVLRHAQVHLAQTSRAVYAHLRGTGHYQALKTLGEQWAIAAAEYIEHGDPDFDKGYSSPPTEDERRDIVERRGQGLRGLVHRGEGRSPIPPL